MTFVEAAIEVLKREGKSLHVKDLARLAIKYNLLTVVGRDPEQTMQHRLQAEVKRATSELTQAGTDVFGLRTFPPRPDSGQRSRPERAQQQGLQMPSREAKEDRGKKEPAKEAEQRPAGRGRSPRKADPERTDAGAAQAPTSEEAGADAPEKRRRRGGRGQASQKAAGAPATREAPEERPAAASESGPEAAQEGPPETVQEPPAAPAPPPVAQEQPAQVAQASESAQAPQPAQSSEAAKEPPLRMLPFAEAVVDVLRGSSEGRPVHFRQITDIALKRRLVRGEPQDLWRLFRASVIRDQRQRDMDGLRTRIRYLGQGMYQLSERKLEPELITAEREFVDRLSRTREATRVALRRRIKALPASALELLLRLLVERMGIIGAELMKRGEGVAYYAGTQTRGVRSTKVLIALRAVEPEVGREAVGELRAGVRLRGFDEGLMLCPSRASQAAVSEVSAAPGIDLYDMDPLVDLLIRHQVGVRRLLLPMDYLDIDLFSELTEPTQGA